MTEAAIGIDIGGTNTVIGAVDKDGGIVKELSIPTSGYGNFDDYYVALTQVVKELQKEIQVIGIGLGSPAGNRFSGVIQAPANVDWEGEIPIGQRLTQSFRLPVVIDNDANTAAIGEMVYGVTKGVKDFITITLGTGLGSGLVIDGKLLYGAQGFAGELGHLVAVRNGRQCGCGKRGCLETYVSATGIKRTIFELLAQENDASVFRSKSFDEVESKDVYTAALAGDSIAKKAFAFTGEILGRSLADYTAFSEPKAFVLFGGLAKSGDLLMQPTKKAFDEELLFLYKDNVEVLLSGLMQKNAAVLGAAALVWDAVEKEHCQIV